MNIFNFFRRPRVRVISIVLVIAIAVLFSYWNLNTISTGAIVKVTEVREEEIVVKNMAGQLTVVKVPPETVDLIDVNENYFIHYERRKWQKARLKRISLQRNFMS